MPRKAATPAKPAPKSKTPAQRTKARGDAKTNLHTVCLAHADKIAIGDPGLAERIEDETADAADYLRALQLLREVDPGAADDVTDEAVESAQESAPKVEANGQATLAT